MGGNVWLAATAARDAVAGEMWLFGAGLGLLVRLAPQRQRGWLLVGLVAFMGLLWLWS